LSVARRLHRQIAMRAWCGIGWAASLADLDQAERMRFLHAVARERLVPCFHEVLHGKVWRVADGDVRHVTGPEADAVLRAIAEAPTGEFPYELVQDFPEVSLPGLAEEDTDVDLPYAPDTVWHVGGVGPLQDEVVASMRDIATIEQPDSRLMRVYDRELFDCLDACSRHLLAFTTTTSE
jgi:hypothetical protein